MGETTEGRENAREKILTAAAHLVARAGVRELTIENVATAAGLSRGGVFYHFASKEAIIQGMMARLIEQFTQYLDGEAARDPDLGGRWARAFVRASFAMDAQTTSVFTALIAAIAYDPRLLDPLRAYLADWRRKTEEGLDPTTAAIARLSSYALWLNGLFHLNDLDDDERRAVIDRIVELTHATPGV